MTYFSGVIRDRLQQAFIENNLKIQTDFVIIENSQNLEEEKIKSIIISAGFCPIISSNKFDGNFAFTIAPYKKPDYFDESFFSKLHEVMSHFSVSFS
jgi:hypothetical protein